MKNVRILLLALLLVPTAYAQDGIQETVKFSNANKTFTVPAGKTWYIHNVFSSVKFNNGDDEYNYVRFKSVDDISFGENGPILTNASRNYIQYPIVFKENTTFELYLNDSSAKGIITYTEVTK
jgi:hypothetical protein